MHKDKIIALGLLWLVSLAALIIALTNVISENPLQKYKFPVAFSFLLFTFYIGKGYKRILKL
jgi:hypothetical protein